MDAAFDSLPLSAIECNKWGICLRIQVLFYSDWILVVGDTCITTHSRVRGKGVAPSLLFVTINRGFPDERFRRLFPLPYRSFILRFVRRRPWHQRYRPLAQRDRTTLLTSTYLHRAGICPIFNQRQPGTVRFRRTRTAAHPCRRISATNNSRMSMPSKVRVVMRHLRVILPAHPEMPSISHLSIHILITPITTHGTYLTTRKPK